GSFVPVLAQRMRCERAPWFSSRSQRSDARISRYALYARCAIAMPILSSTAGGTLPFAATSQRLTNSDATDATCGFRPAATRRTRQVLDREVEEEVLSGPALGREPADPLVVVGALRDRLIEDRRVGREAGHRQLVHVLLERARIEQPARDVVEPDALTGVVQL